jgi:hypothetical protein
VQKELEHLLSLEQKVGGGGGGKDNLRAYLAVVLRRLIFFVF